MESGINAGHIYSVMTYMWMFATSLDDAPQLLEKFSQLRDIGKRVSTDDETFIRKTMLNFYPLYVDWKYT